MRLHLIAVGARMPEWVNTAYAGYAKRLHSGCRLELREIPAGRRSRSADIARILRIEGDRCLDAVPSGARIIALERQGRVLPSDQVAEAMGRWLQEGRDVAFLVGGPEGLAPQCLQRADELWSLSALTLPHTLVRVLLAEQLYRAWSMLNHLPYHRE
ncbi:MAG: 23S rRNA (pseudouridine(1915)-N(3))-methyltransferase RlmH [Gammaproteobacteria bacterium]|nr:23S rRNA (pseudouridine(1915)-N(3))-methyltransferase RlmH [Gammaproteobacteria bacterium]